MMPDGSGERGLAQTEAAVDEERVILLTRPVGDGQCRRMRELIAGADNEFGKNVARVKLRMDCGPSEWPTGIGVGRHRSLGRLGVMAVVIAVSSFVHVLFAIHLLGP